MVLFKSFKYNSKRIMFFLFLSVFPITANAMLQSWKNLTSSIAQHVATRTNLYKFSKFQKMMSFAPISSQSSFNSKKSKSNKWVASGIGTLGFSAIAMNQKSKKNTEFNELIRELKNNETTNQEIKTSYKSKGSMFNVFSDTTLLGVTNILHSFIDFQGTILHCRENDIITMPNADELQKRLSSVGMDHFAEKTSIISRLAGQQIVAMDVAMAIELSFYDYFEYMKQGMPEQQFRMMQAVTSMNKPLLYKELLKDNPEALDELKTMGFYKPIN